MIDLEIITQSECYKLYISKLKYFYTDDYNIKSRVINAIEGYFLKEKDSEYAKEMNYTSKLLSDEKPISIGDYEYYKITDSFDFKNDFKLGSKSLLLKYLEIKTQKLEYLDNYQTFQIILKGIEDEFNLWIEEDIHSLEIDLKIELEKKNLMKLIVPQIIKNGFYANFLDITYDELIQLQIELLLNIANSSEKKTILIVDVPSLNDEIINLLHKFTNKVFIIVFCRTKSKNIMAQDIYLCYNKIKIDLYDDNAIYDLSLNESKNFTVEEYRMHLIDQFII